MKSLKFGVITREGLALSGIWTVTPHTNRAKSDVFVTATGLQGASKFSFHRDILNHSWLSETHRKLVDDGIAPDGPRHWQSVPIDGLPWHGLTVRFVDNLLRKEGRSLDHIDGDIVALDPPEKGQVLDVGFILAEGPGLQIDNVQFIIGQVGGGGRSLVVVGRYTYQETESQKTEYQENIAKIPVPKTLSGKLDGTEDLAMLLFGQEQGFLVVTEVHNVRVNSKN